ncbi:hypothetical protein GCM10007301_09230 [Azorhizobium oxalatiphilum]|uniref:Tetratricopeptide repeat protein n=1 Tax=Azorhizobium oxalatiphilum TaxID=980631 RepID=A0A917F685_9HYPH|nr:hypothetical protein [Azorhizobium oxalatiphilum]GGF51936.1 hypothetical protein GCM10007301_09230 [Azorhizobium oxalatiphilum]
MDAATLPRDRTRPEADAAARAAGAAPAGSTADAEWVDRLLGDPLLGGGLPEAAEAELKAASLAYADSAVAEAHLKAAQALAPGHVAVLIGLYRFYFYKGRLAQALAVARECLVTAGRSNNFSTDWREVRATDADFSSYEALKPRFFLFTLKGYAYLQMRLGDLQEGRAAATKLMQLDPSDKIGARLLLDVADRAEAAQAEPDADG